MQSKTDVRADKFQMISDWKKSGLSQKAYCKANNVAYHHFHYWYGVYQSDKKPAKTFLPVKIVQPVQEDRITITGNGGVELKFPFNEQSMRFIKQLLLS
jgi:hypothetical protein